MKKKKKPTNIDIIHPHASTYLAAHQAPMDGALVGAWSH
jgi:hypothetical protein